MYFEKTVLTQQGFGQTTNATIFDKNESAKIKC